MSILGKEYGDIEESGDCLLSNQHSTVMVSNLLYKDCVILLDSKDEKYQKPGSFIFRRLVHVLCYDSLTWAKLNGSQVMAKYFTNIEAIIGTIKLLSSNRKKSLFYLNCNFHHVRILLAKMLNVYVDKCARRQRGQLKRVFQSQ